MSAILALVAMNTLIFLGLSVAKIIPWPDPVHPAMLRPTEHHEGGTRPGAVRQRLLLALTMALARIT